MCKSWSCRGYGCERLGEWITLWVIEFFEKRHLIKLKKTIFILTKLLLKLSRKLNTFINRVIPEEISPWIFQNKELSSHLPSTSTSYHLWELLLAQRGLNMCSCFAKRGHGKWITIQKGLSTPHQDPVMEMAARKYLLALLLHLKDFPPTSILLEYPKVLYK